MPLLKTTIRITSVGVRPGWMRAALKEANKPCEIIVYPDTPHGFNADYRPTYRKEQAEDGWTRMLDWFKKNGVA